MKGLILFFSIMVIIQCLEEKKIMKADFFLDEKCENKI